MSTTLEAIERFDPGRVFDFGHPYPKTSAERRLEMLDGLVSLDATTLTDTQQQRLLEGLETLPSVTEYTESVRQTSFRRMGPLSVYPESLILYAREEVVPLLARQDLPEYAQTLASRLPTKAHRFEAKRNILSITHRPSDAQALLDTAQEPTGHWLKDGHSYTYWPDVVHDALESGSHIEVARTAARLVERAEPHPALLWLAIYDRSQEQLDLGEAQEMLQQYPIKPGPRTS